jgi:ABC-2 type transport system permease protein
VTTQSTDPAVHAEAIEVSTGRLFARTCAAEWTRLWSVKSTWWFLAAAAVTMVGLGTIAGFDAGGNAADAQGDPAWEAANFTAMPAQFALLALVLAAVTADYATGGIVPALQWTPRRTVLFLARTVVAAGTATGLGVLLGLASALGGYAAARPVLTLPLDEGIDVLSTVGFVFGAGSLLAVGLGFLLRNTAGALVAVFLLILVLPALLPQFGYDWLTDFADVLPGTNAFFLLLEEPAGRGLTETASVVTMLGWAGGALLLGWLRLLQHDATG